MRRIVQGLGCRVPGAECCVLDSSSAVGGWLDQCVYPLTVVDSYTAKGMDARRNVFT